MRVLLFLLIFASVGTANAAVCVENNSSNCGALGYTKKSCPYGGVRCPYDTSLWYCGEWTCADGRYEDAAVAGKECVSVSYKGMNCYDCSGCSGNAVDVLTCWSGKLNTILNNSSQCSSLGYIHTAGSCTSYVACPADLTKIRCLN